MGGRVWRLAVGFLAVATMIGVVPGGSAAAAAGHLVWLPVVPAPLVPRWNAGLVGLSPTTVLAFGGRSEVAAATRFGALGSPLPAADTAVFDEATMSWRRTAPLPPEVDPNLVSTFSPWSPYAYLEPVGADGFAWDVEAERDAAGNRRNVVFRYTASADRWDVFAAPPVRVDRLIAAGPRLVVLDTESEHPGIGPSGAVLDATGRWQLLPADPFPDHPLDNARWDELLRKDPSDPARLHMSPYDWLRDGVWTGTRLLLIGGPDKGPRLSVAALDLDQLGSPAGRWSALLSVSAQGGRGQFTQPPTFVAGRVVWQNVVYDPATGVSTPTTAAIASPPHPGSGSEAVPPDGVVLGDRVVLGGNLFDPVSGSWEPCPPAPELALAPDLHQFFVATIAGFVAWVGGPAGILHFGGLAEPGGLGVGGVGGPVIPAGLLRPVG